MNLKTLMALLVLLLSLSCRKETRNVNEEIPIAENSFLSEGYVCLNNPANDYDARGKNIIEVLEMLKYNQYDTTQAGLNAYLQDLDSTSQEHVNWSLDNGTFSSDELVFLNSFRDSLQNLEHSLEAFVNGVINIENEVIHSELSENEKERVLTIFSVMRHTVGYNIGSDYEFIEYGLNGYEERLTACINRSLEDIFTYGNWIDQTLFIAGCPLSFLEILASCAWDASQGTPNWQDYVNNYLYISWTPQEQSSCY